MLTYNLDFYFNLYGIENKQSYLKKNGFTGKEAYKLVHNQYKVLNFKMLEKLCLLFNCTPNDIIDFIPSKGTNYNGKKLLELKKEKIPSITDLFRDKTIEEVLQLHKEIREMIAKKE